MKRTAIVVAAVLLSGAAKDPYAKLDKLTVDNFTRKMEKREDDLTTDIIFSTQSGYRKQHTSGGWLFGVDSDLWLKVSVDKRTRKKAFFVMAFASWIGNYTIWQSATFTTPSGPRESNVINGANSQVGSCVSGGCSYGGTIALAVDEITLREIATTHAPWRFRFRSTTGVEFENAISPVEAEAILNAVNDK